MTFIKMFSAFATAVDADVVGAESMELLGQAAESYALGRLDKPMKSLAFLKAMLG